MMRKVTMIILIIAVFTMAGCQDVETTASDEASSENGNASDIPYFLAADSELNNDNTMVEVESVDSNIWYSILVDRETRVMYLFAKGYEKGGLVLMENADGTPRIWDKELD